MEIDRQTIEHATVSLSGAHGLPLPEDQDAYTRGFVAALQFLTTADAVLPVKPGIVSTASADENNAMSYSSFTPSSISDATMSPPVALHATHPFCPPGTFTDLSAATVPVSRQSQVVNNRAQTSCVSPHSADLLATHSYVGSVSGYAASPPLVNGGGSEALRPFSDGGKNNDVWRYFDNGKCDNTVDGVASSAANECSPFTFKNAEDYVLGVNLQDSDLNTESDDCEETLTFSSSSSASSSFSTSATSSGRPRLWSRNNRQEEKRKRNRDAAARCRAKKLDNISTLSERVQSLKGENSHLVSSVTALREDISRLKEQLIKHAAVGCLKLAPGAV